MIIKVTQEHIDKGRIGPYCPVELAIKEALPALESVHVSSQGKIRLQAKASLENGWLGPVHRLEYPKVADFVEAYDNERYVEPFEFEI